MRSDRIVFVTGTDTGVGKTFVSAALLRFLRNAGCDAVGIKPVETGCGVDDREDGCELARASGQSAPIAALTRLRQPVAPPVAAEAEHAVLSGESWIRAIDQASENHELVLVEGAGGLLSPLTWRMTLRDLITTTGGRSLVVAADRLGSINHARLTVEALGDRVLGVVFSAPAVPDLSTGTNADALRKLLPAVRVSAIARHATWIDAAEHVREIASWVDT